MSSRNAIKLSDLPPAAREQATRAVSRDLARGTKPVSQPAAPHKPAPVLKTFYRAAALYAAVKTERAERKPEDHYPTRYFTDELAAWDWVYETIRDERNRLAEMADAVMERRARAATRQPQT